MTGPLGRSRTPEWQIRLRALQEQASSQPVQGSEHQAGSQGLAGFAG